MKNPSKYQAFSFLFAAVVATGCASNRQFTEGEYDDVNQVRLLDDKFNESDITELAGEMIGSMAAHPIFIDAKIPPIVQVEEVRNKTSEHIDTKSITDTVRTALIKTGKVRFANKEDRATITEEIDYQQQSGRVRRDTQKRRDGSLGTDYVLTGDLISNVQEVGNKKLVFYRLTLNLTNVTTGLIEWSEEKPIRKRFKKRSVGM
jgi:uncharacterized protein (TIGR02722 family)